MNTSRGFTLIEAITAIMIIAVISSSIMVGITTVEKKLFYIRLKEKAFEELKNYTDFMASRIMVGDIPGDPPDEGYNLMIYQKLKKDEIQNIYSANINYEKVEKVSNPQNNGQVYKLNTSIIWPNELDFKDTLTLNTFQIVL